MTGRNTPNLVLKRMLRYFQENTRTFSKVLRLKKILEFQNQKKTMKLVQKENSEPKIKRC